MGWEMGALWKAGWSIPAARATVLGRGRIGETRVCEAEASRSLKAAPRGVS